MIAEGVAEAIREVKGAVARRVGQEDRELLATGTSDDVAGTWDAAVDAALAAQGVTG